MRVFTRDSDDMNEVLADFIGYNVEVKVDMGVLRGPLEVDPDPYTDGYKIGPYCFEKREVVLLIDRDPRP